MKKRAGRRLLRTVRPPGTELAGLRGGFLAWLAGKGVPPEVDESALWDDVVTTVDLAATRAGLTDLRSWTIDQVTTLTAGASGDEDAALAALPLLLAFLGETGRWHGTPEDFEAVLAVADRATSPMAAAIGELGSVTVDPAAERAALEDLPLVARAETLLRFLSPRRPVTGTGGLKRADTVAAAERLGLVLATDRPRSMWDVLALATLWESLVDAELLVVTQVEATPSLLAHRWLSGDADAGHEARLRLVGAYLTAVLTAPSPAPWLPPPLAALLPVLGAAALDRPVPADLSTLPLGAGGTLADVDDELAAFASLAVLPAQRSVDRLADAGIVQLSDAVTVAPGLRGLVARLVAGLLAHAGAGGDDGPPPPDPALQGQAYRLRIELEGARPPVWREVLIDPNLPLDELHDVIQQVFGWEDYHLHEFTELGSRSRGRRFAPPAEDAWDLPGHETTDEATVRLASLIGPRRGALRYRYDFGDSWDHRITVVGSEPAAPAALPTCVAGAGLAPVEDSGGVWGWADKLEIARDPRHPEHQHVREWLDLADGEQPDPAAFDRATVEERLRPLRPQR